MKAMSKIPRRRMVHLILPQYLASTFVETVIPINFARSISRSDARAMPKGNLA